MSNAQPPVISHLLAASAHLGNLYDLLHPFHAALPLPSSRRQLLETNIGTAFWDTCGATKKENICLRRPEENQTLARPSMANAEVIFPR